MAYKNPLVSEEQLQAARDLYSGGLDPFIERPYFDVSSQTAPNLEEADTSEGMFSKLSTMSALQLLDNHEWAQRAYNESTAGLAYQLMHGKSRYENVPERDKDNSLFENIAEDVSGMFLGMLNPVETGVMLATWGTGTLAMKALGKPALKKLAFEGLKNLGSKQMDRKLKKEAKNEIFKKYYRRQAGFETGVNFGTLGAAHATLHESARQSKEIAKGVQDDYNYNDIIWEATKGFGTSAALGAGAGYVAKGIMGSKLAQLRKAKDENFRKTTTYLANNPASQVLAESSIFSGGQLTLDALMTGEIPDGETILRSLADNTLMFGGFRAAFKPFRLGQNDLTRYKEAKLNLYGSYEPYAKRMVKSANKNLMKRLSKDDAYRKIIEEYEKNNLRVPKELLEELELTELARVEGETAIKDLESIGKRITELSEKDISKLSNKEKAELIEGATIYNATLNSLYSELKANPELAYEMYKDLFKGKGKELTDANKAAIRGIIDNRLENTHKFSEYINESAKNNTKNPLVKQSHREGGNKEKWVEPLEGEKPVLPGGETVKAVIINPNTQKPMFGADGKPIVREMSKFEFERLEAEGKAMRSEKYRETGNTLKDDQIGAIDGSKADLAGQLKGIREQLIEMQRKQEERMPASIDTPMSATKLREKINDYSRVLFEDPVNLTPSEQVFRKKYEAAVNKIKKGEKYSKGDINNLTELEQAAFLSYFKERQDQFLIDLKTGRKSKNRYDMATRDSFDVPLMLLDFLRRKKKNILSATPADLAEFILNAKKVYGRRVEHSDPASALSLFAKHLKNNDFVKGSNITAIEQAASAIFADFNAIGKGKPAKVGVRKSALAAGKEMGLKEEIAARLGAIFGIRDEEINRINFKRMNQKNNEVLKQDNQGNYYLDINKKNIGKFKSDPGIVYIDKTTATMLKDFIDGGGDLKGAVTNIGKKLPSDSKAPFKDLRKRIQTLSVTEASKLGLTTEEYFHLNSMLRHDKSRVQKHYEIPTIERNIEIQKSIIKKMGMAEEIGMEFMKADGTKVPATPLETSKMTNWLRTKYPELVLKIEKDLGMDKGREILGDYFENVIRIKEGRAPADTIPHEAAHHVFKVLESMGDRKSQSLVKEAKKIFGGEEAAVKDIGLYVTGRLKDTGMMPRIKNWLTRFNAHLKNFFGVGKLNKKDITALLGERVLKRQGIPLAKIKGMKAREFMLEFDSVDKVVKSVNNDIKQTFNTLKIRNPQEKAELMRSVARMAGIENPDILITSSGKLSGKASVPPEDVFNFASAFADMDVSTLAGKANTVKWFTTYSDIKRQARIKNITPEMEKEILFDFGVPKGELINANTRQLENYRSLVYASKDQYVKPSDWVPSDMAYISDKHLGMASKFKRWFKTKFYPEHIVIGDLGYKTIRNQLEKHVGVESGHYGRSLEYMENKVITGWKDSRTGEIYTGIGNRKFNKMKDKLFWTLDHKGERFLDALKDGSISKAEEAYFREAIAPEWFETVNKANNSGASLNARDTNGRLKYINTKTDAGKAAAAWVDFVNYWPQALKDALKINLNEAQYKQFLKDNNVQWIEDGIYVNRSVTDAYRRHKQLDSKALSEWVEKKGWEIAVEQATAKEGPTVSKEVIRDKYYENAKQHAESLLVDLENFNVAKFNSKYLKGRHLKLPETIKVGDKTIQVYEKGYDVLAKKYAFGMSKLLANIEFFPEFVNMKGFKMSPEHNAKAMLGGIKKTNPDHYSYVESLLQRRLGIGDYNPFSMGTGALRSYANVLAKTQLSFPTSGLKNFLVGNTQTLFAYDIRDIASNIAQVYSKENQRFISKTGAKSHGSRHWEENNWASKFLDKTVFKAGLMTVSENFNRSFNVLIGRTEANKLFKVISDKAFDGSPKYNKAVNRLKDFFFLNDADISFIKKYGMSSDLSKFNLSQFDKKRILKRMESIEDTVNTYSHVNTQGSSVDIFMPAWASGKTVKPLTLFKRMAYAATVNTNRNVGLAFKNKNIMKLALGTLGTYSAGMAMEGVYSYLLGSPMPNENSNWAKYMSTIMWRGEFMGIMSEFLSPYFGDDIPSTLYPAVYTHAYQMAYLLGEVMTDRRDWTGPNQFFDQALNKSFALAGGLKKVSQRTYNPYHKQFLRIRKLHKEWEKEAFPNNPDGTFERTTKNPYFDKLSHSFSIGDMEGFAKQYLVTQFMLANDYWNQGMAPSIDKNGQPIRIRNIEEALKQAQSTMKTKLTMLNPNPKSYMKAKTKLAQRKAISFWNYLTQEQKNEIKKQESEYNKRVRMFKRILPQFLRKNHLRDMIKDYDWVKGKR